ncbi:MAG TPA: hypothetical protein PKD55_24285, partial [Bellilinea sp.]|nr:hypothetical protein [Bellilinea sp.]
MKITAAMTEMPRLNKRPTTASRGTRLDRRAPQAGRWADGRVGQTALLLATVENGRITQRPPSARQAVPGL